MVPAAFTVHRPRRWAALCLVLCVPAAAAAAQAPPEGSATAAGPVAAVEPAPGATQASEEPAAPAEEPTSIFSHPDGRLWVAGQANFIYQANLPFHSPYAGPHSLQARPEERLSRVLSLYSGLRLWRGAEALVDFESAGGRALSDTLGLAGFTNLDVVRNPKLGSQPYLARALYHQTWALGQDTEANDRVPVSSAARVPAQRFDLWVGKLSTVDIFDQNAAGGDSHLQFLNWTVDNNGAFDYAADTRGYTYGVVGELHESRFSLRAGIETMPKVANGIDLDLRLDRARGQNVEAEVRPTLAGHDGAVRLLVYRNVADMGSYREAVDGFLLGRDPVPDITRYREQGRTKTGCGLNFEQEVSPTVRVFGRWGVDDGRTESFAYTEVDGTLELGADLRLQQEKHKAGIAWVANRLSGPHRTYLELGGLGFLLGDGRLDYGQEQIVETYYNYRIWRGLYLGADLQHVANPGYNRDRGPVWVPSSRLHIDF
jgi:high affinity Mn2+ porin